MTAIMLADSAAFPGTAADAVLEELRDRGRVNAAAVLDPEQLKAVAAIREAIDAGRDLFVGGLAGTGKSTVLAEVARKTPSGMLVAPTGKAASVLSRKARLPATTIHRAIYGAPVEWIDENGDRHLEWPEKIEPGALAGRTFLLDECSMVSEEIAAHMRATGANIIAVGDPGQLPPVNGRQAFTVTDITLREIHRQALGSPIIRQAHAVRGGRSYEPDGEDFRVVGALSDDALYEADMVLTHTNDSRQTMNDRCRRLRGRAAPYPQRGEPVVCLVSSALHGLFNGEVYRVLQDFEPGDREIYIVGGNGPQKVPAIFLQAYAGKVDRKKVWPLISFGFGYALTTHRCQGSEYPRIVLKDENQQKDRVPWLYTGITRASERIVVVRE